jgi:hypothetical protein
MENIGDKDSAIAERVRALLAAANSSAATAAAAPPVAVVAPVPAPLPAGVRRLDPASTDPATVVANLTVAGIRYAVSYFRTFYIAGWLYYLRWIQSHPWIHNVLTRFLFVRILPSSILLSYGSKKNSCGCADPYDFYVMRIRALVP